MPLLYQGSDDNALAVVVAEFAIDIAIPSGNTRNAIDVVAAAAGVDLSGETGSDRNAIEALYALLEAMPSGPACTFTTPYVFVNDGSLLMVDDWPTFDPVAQSAGWTAPGDTGDFGAIPNGTMPAGGMVLLGAGNVAVCEFAVDMPAIAGEAIQHLGIQVVSSDMAASEAIRIYRAPAFGYQSVVQTTQGSVETGHGLAALVDLRVQVYVIGDTGAIGYKVNGVDAGTLPIHRFAGKAGVIFALIGASTGVDAVGTGEIRFISNPALFSTLPPCEVPG